MLVAVGQYTYGRRKTVEVLNLDEANPNVTCQNLPDLPFVLSGAMGQLYKGKTPIICGGDAGFGTKSDCHSFENGTWNKMASLSVPRESSGSAKFTQGEDEILLITGGYNGKEHEQLSTVDSFDGQTWNQEKFPDLPRPNVHHCMVKMNNSMLLQIGGTYGMYSAVLIRDTYFFDINENRWFEGPALNQPRQYHSCGVMNWINPNTESEEKIVVVAGGQPPLKVELLYLNNLQAGWVYGPSLLGDMMGPESRMIEFQNSVILIGGYSEDIAEQLYLYQLSSPNGPWKRMKQNLKQSRMAHVTFLIPDELVDCQ